MSKFLPFMLLFFFISGSFATIFNPVFASELVENSWNIKTPMNQARADLGVVAVDSKIYAIGGYTTFSEAAINAYYPIGYVGTNEQYDPITDKWVTLKSMPTPRGNFAIVAYQNKIYCIGGGTCNKDGWIKCDTVEVYDTITDSWSTKASISYDGMCVQANVIEGKIFVINRVYPESGNVIYELYLYDPVTDLWTQKASIPRPDDIAVYSDIFYSFSIAMDNKIMVYFKYMYGYWAFKGKVMTYDPKTNAWNEEGTPPVMSGPYQSLGEGLNSATGSWATTGVYAPKKVYVLGLTANDNEGQSNWVYDPESDTWSFAKAMPVDRAGFGVAVVDDILYVIGGTINGSFSNIVEQYVPIGYSSTCLVSKPSTTVTPAPSDSFVFSEPEPSETSEPFLNNLTTTVVTIVISAGIVAVALFFYLKGQKGK